MDADGKVSAALEVIAYACGLLYGFHRMSGQADLALQEAVEALRTAGQSDLAEQIDDVLVGRDVIPGMWTYQIVEADDEHYWQVFLAAAEKVRRQLVDGARHAFEAELKVKWVCQVLLAPDGQGVSRRIPAVVATVVNWLTREV